MSMSGRYRQCHDERRCSQGRCDGAGAGQLTDAGRLLVTGLAWLLYAAGWSVARLCRVVAVTVGGLLYGVGWSAGRVALAGRWTWAAVRVGWDDGRQPIGGRR